MPSCIFEVSEAGLQIRWTTRRCLIALALLAVLACALCVSTYRIFGNFWDEPEHIAAGLVLIDRGEYRYDVQHPPFARLAAAIGPYLAGARFHGEPDPIGDAAGRDLLYHSSASYETLLTLARLGMLPFLLLLLGATFQWTRHWYGAPPALLAVLFLVSCPVILGHAAVVAVDVPVTALTMASLYLLLRWFEAPGLGRGLAFGLAAGLAVATKVSAIPFIGVAAAALAAVRLALLRAAPLHTPLRSQLAPRVRSMAAGLLLALAVVFGVYGDRLVYLTTPDLAPSRALNFYVGTHGALHDLAYRIAAHVPLPFGFAMVPENILGVEWHNTHGHLSFLLGQLASNGWWYFYPVALAVKTPLPLLLLGLTGLALLAVRGARAANLYLMAPSVCFVAIMSFCCLYSHINIGVRHVLIAYPLLAMGAGYALPALWERWCSRLARSALLALLLWQVATLAYAYPDYLAYFNAIAGEHPERILVDSDLDWGGQDLRRLERVLAARHVSSLWIGYKGTADLSLEALPPFKPLMPHQPVTGWVAITMLTLQEDPAGYEWLQRYRPVQRVGQSFELYDIR
jgi:4-amino-4-deoxy-L-arabinose transferase-like glycosyltransferase